MRKELWRFVAVCATVWAALFASGAGSSPDHRPGRLLVRFSSGTADSRVRSAVASIGGTLGPEIGHTGYRVVEVPEGAGLRPEADSAKMLCYDGAVADVQYDIRVAPDATPNDTYFSSQWHLAKMGCPAAWEGTRGSSSVIIAILDTGVDGTHPDLSAKMVAGWNTYDNNSNTADVYGHGTAVAGTAAASTNNGAGVAGVAWDCSIMPVRISDSAGYGYSSTVSNGLVWAADHGARVANISYGFTNDSVVRAAAKYFSDKGGVVTVSAGNSGLTDSNPDNPYVLTVSATDSNDAIASWSNRGSNVDVSAPGVGISTTVRGGSYAAWSGTSFSAPATAGVAALVISACPSLTGPEVQAIIRNTADDLGAPGWDQVFAMGRVNADKAVAEALNGNLDGKAPSVAFSSPANGSKVVGSVLIDISATDNVAVASVVLKKDGVSVATFTSTPYRWLYNSTLDADGTHTFTVTASDAAGNQSSTALALTVENTDSSAPSVAFTSPASGAKVSGSVVVYLSASDNRGVSSVVLKKDGAVVATLTAAPYRWTYSTTSDLNGSHALTATAKDAAGNEAVASLNLTVANIDRKAPTVRFTSPTNGSTVQGSVVVSLDAADNQGVAAVEIRKDKVLVATLTAAPYVWTYNSATDKNGKHTFIATARDSSGNKASATIYVKVANPDVTAPSVTLKVPAGGKLGNTVVLTAVATDNVKVAQVAFYMDGVLVGTSKRAPFRCSLNGRKLATGEHTFQAVAIDTSGNSGQSPAVAATK
jgi:thermitase